MFDKIEKVEAFALSVPRDEPYLGPLEKGVAPNAKGYFVRTRNKSIYPMHDQVVLVKLTSTSGAVGWGECYGILAPQAVVSIIRELIGPVVEGRDPRDPAVIYEDLYDLMRVRGFFGGFYVDAIAGIDIAVWDLFGKLIGLPVVKLLGGQRRETIPAYVSGLPKPTVEERQELAKRWMAKGFKALKFASAVSFEGEVAEMKAIREAVGPDVDICVDMHWRHTAQEAIKLINQMDQYNLYFAEAPVESEDLEGQAQVAHSVSCPTALGEELRTRYEYRPRFEKRCMSIIQPEMGHIGITEFMNICRMAAGFHVRTIPHASMSIGIFTAASLHCAAALPAVPYHEYQHSIFDKNLKYVTGDMKCEAGFYQVPEGPGLGVEPTQEVFDLIIKD